MAGTAAIAAAAEAQAWVPGTAAAAALEAKAWVAGTAAVAADSARNQASGASTSGVHQVGLAAMASKAAAALLALVFQAGSRA